MSRAITQECVNDKNRVQKLLETFCIDSSHLRFYEVAAVLPHVQIVPDSSATELFRSIGRYLGI